MPNTSTDCITAYAALRRRGGPHLFLEDEEIGRDNIADYLPGPEERHRALQYLSDLGFDIEWQGRLHVKISGPAQLYHGHFGTRFKIYDFGPGQGPEAAMLVPAEEPELDYEDLDWFGIAGIAHPEPVSFYQGLSSFSPDPPDRPGILTIPDELVEALDAEEIHDAGQRGAGVLAAIIDDGFFWSHPYFTSRAYDFHSLPAGQSRAETHGTAMAALLLALAPEARLYGLSGLSELEAFDLAREHLGVSLVSCSWGTDAATDERAGECETYFSQSYWRSVQAEIALCAQAGMTVLFAAGNKGKELSFTASMPETLSVGGAHLSQAGPTAAPDVALHFESCRFGTRVPDVSGLVGKGNERPLVTQPSLLGDYDDDFPPIEDGWMARTETSSACAMVAGVAALLLAERPELSGEDVRQALMETAIPAGQGTGAGLVRAAPAWRKVRDLG